MYRPFFRSITPKIITVISNHLILNVINMSLNESDVNVANGIANDVLPVMVDGGIPFTF